MIHKVYEPYRPVRLGTAAHFCEVVVLKSLEPLGPVESARCRAMRVQLKRFPGLLPENQGHNLVLTVLYQFRRVAGPHFAFRVEFIVGF